MTTLHPGVPCLPTPLDTARYALFSLLLRSVDSSASFTFFSGDVCQLAVYVLVHFRESFVFAYQVILTRSVSSLSRRSKELGCRLFGRAYA